MICPLPSLTGPSGLDAPTFCRRASEEHVPEHSVFKEPDFVNVWHAGLLAHCLHYDVIFHDGHTVTWRDPRINNGIDDGPALHTRNQACSSYCNPGAPRSSPEIHATTSCRQQNSHRLPLFCTFEDSWIVSYNRLARRANRVLCKVPNFEGILMPCTATREISRDTRDKPVARPEIPSKSHKNGANTSMGCSPTWTSKFLYSQHRKPPIHRMVLHPCDTTSTQLQAGPFCLALPDSTGRPANALEDSPAVSVYLPIPSADLETWLQDSGSTTYVFFDVQDHYRRRQLLPGWGLRDIIEDAVTNSRAQPVHAARILKVPLSGLPVIQVVLDSANLPPYWITTPVDIRALDEAICTIGVPDEASAYEVALSVDRFCRLRAPLATNVARGRVSFCPPGTILTDPFRPHILDNQQTIIGLPRGERHASESSLDSGSTASSTSEHSDFHCIEAPEVQVSEGFTVAFHAVGHPPWVHTFASTATPSHVAAHASQHMACQTSQRSWRTQFLWRQPVVSGVDLHCLLTPTENAPARGGVFLADFRRIFGPGLRGLAALPAEPHTPQTTLIMRDAAVRCLHDWALAHPPLEFVVTTARRGALLVPESEDACAVVETFDIAIQLPGFRQILLTQHPPVGAVEGTSHTVIPCPDRPSTTTTTTAMQGDELPYFVWPLPPSNPLLVRLGVASAGVFTVEFQGNPPAEEIMSRVWAAAAQEHSFTEPLDVHLAPCQPPAWVSHREVLIIASPAQDQQDEVSVWLDLRPQGTLTFRRVKRHLQPEALLGELKGFKGLYRNGQLWSTPGQLKDGDYIAGSVVPQAPDVRPNDYFIQRVARLSALLIPLTTSPQLLFETTTCYELDQSMALRAWSELLQTRSDALGLEHNPVDTFLIIGPRVEIQGALKGDALNIKSVGEWAQRWLFPIVGRFILHDTEGLVQGRRLFIHTSPDMNSFEQYIRIHVTGNAVQAFTVPHSTSPSELVKIAPIADAESRPVPGRSWFGSVFPSTNLHRALDIHSGSATLPSSDATTPAGATSMLATLSNWRRQRFLLRVADIGEGDPGTAIALEALERTAEEDTRATTTTTTAARAHQRARDVVHVPGRPLLFLITGSAIAGQELQEITCESMAASLAELLSQHKIRGQGPTDGCLKMALSHPGRTTQYREILMLWHPLDFDVHILVDCRGIGGGIGHRAVDSDVDPLTLVPHELQPLARFIYINGVPLPIFRSPLQDGDYVTFETQAPSMPAIPRSALFRNWPMLSLLGVDLLLDDMARIPDQALAMVRAITERLRDAFDVRMNYLGFHLEVRQQALLYSRYRGEIMVLAPNRLPVQRREVEDIVPLIPEWNGASHVVDSGVMSLDASVFLVQDTYESRETWHLIPLPFFAQLYLLWPVDAMTLRRVNELPAPAGQQVNTRSWVRPPFSQPGKRGHQPGADWVR